MPRPDEGLIHAWLDGQLPPDEAARVEQLAATDPEWAAAVAEARGLVAASSRILAALDHVPSGVLPKQAITRPRRGLPWWTKVAAAVVIVGTGSLMMLRETPRESVSIAEPVQQPAAPMPAKPAAATIAAADATPTRANAAEPAVRKGKDAVAPERSIGAVAAAAPSRDTVVAVEARDVAAAERVLREREAAPAPAVAAKAAAAPEALMVPPQASAQNAVPAQRVTSVGGVAGGRAAALRAEARQAPVCYRIIPDGVPAVAAVVVRLVRVDGDTLRLEGVRSTAAETVWLVPRESGWRGVMFTRGDTVRVVPVTGTRTLCPAP